MKGMVEWCYPTLLGNVRLGKDERYGGVVLQESFHLRRSSVQS